MNRYVTMGIAAACLGFIGIFTKLVGDSIPLLTLNMLRMAVGTIGVYVLIQFRNDCTLCGWKRQLKHNILGGLLIAIAFTAYVSANALGPVTNAVILLYLNPVFVMLFGWLFLRERISLTHVIAFLGALAGIIILNPLKSGVLIANLLSFGAAIVYGGYIVYMRKNSIGHTISFLFWSFLVSTIILTPFSVVELLMKGIAFSASQLWIIPLGLISTALGYVLFSYSLEKLSAENGALISMTITPLVAVIAAILLFAEHPSMSTLIGGVLLIGSVVFLQRSNYLLRRKKENDHRIGT